MQSISKWHVLVGGFLAYLFDAMEIILLTIALPVIQQDLGLTIGQAGMLASATLLGIGFSSITTGWYSDNFGRRKALLLSLVSFGALTMAVASTTHWYLLLVLRFFSGLGLGGRVGHRLGLHRRDLACAPTRPRHRLRAQFISRGRSNRRDGGKSLPAGLADAVPRSGDLDAYPCALPLAVRA